MVKLSSCEGRRVGTHAKTAEPGHFGDGEMPDYNGRCQPQGKRRGKSWAGVDTV